MRALLVAATLTLAVVAVPIATTAANIDNRGGHADLAGLINVSDNNINVPI
jgi:hypothetical protein